MDEGKTIDRETKKKRNGTTKSKYIKMTKKKRTRCIPHSYFTTYPLPIQLRDIRFRNSYPTILIGILFGCLCLPPQWLIFLFMCSFFLSFIFSRLYFCAPNHYNANIFQLHLSEVKRDLCHRWFLFPCSRVKIVIVVRHLHRSCLTHTFFTAIFFVANIVLFRWWKRHLRNL